MKRLFISLAFLLSSVLCAAQSVPETPEHGAFFEGDWTVCSVCPESDLPDTLRVEYAIVIFFPETYEFVLSIPVDGDEGAFDSRWFSPVMSGYMRDGSAYYAAEDGSFLSILDSGGVFRVRLAYDSGLCTVTYSGEFKIEDDVD